MNNLINKISRYFGEKSIMEYPELLRKERSRTMEHRLAAAFSSGSYEHDDNKSIDWKTI